MVPYCLGSLTSCDGGGEYLGGEVDFILNLDDSTYKL